MGESRASGRRLQTLARSREALSLRVEGKTFAEIGTNMGYSEQRAHSVVTRELMRLSAARTEQSEAVLRLEIERLDALWRAVWPTAKEGDLPSIETALRLMARRAKLLGLDAPKHLSVEAHAPMALQIIEHVVERIETR